MLTRFFIKLITLYQKTLSPFLPQSCKYYPSCSHYAVKALHQHGLLKGLVLSVWRVLRCNPWSRGGIDDIV